MTPGEARASRTSPIGRRRPSLRGGTTSKIKDRGGDRVLHHSYGNGEHFVEDVTDKPAPTVLASGPKFFRTRVVDDEDVSRATVDGDVAQGFAGTELEKKWEELRPGQVHGKNFNLHRMNFDTPAAAINAMGSGRTLPSIAHPSEPRKFSIDELKAICSFPADFVLTGTYSQQWERCGDAVPPLMMRAIARALVPVLAP